MGNQSVTAFHQMFHYLTCTPQALLFVDDIYGAGNHNQKGGLHADIADKTVYPDKGCIVVAHVDLNNLPGSSWTP